MNPESRFSRYRHTARKISKPKGARVKRVTAQVANCDRESWQRKAASMPLAERIEFLVRLHQMWVRRIQLRMPRSG